MNTRKNYQSRAEEKRLGVIIHDDSAYDATLEFSYYRGNSFPSIMMLYKGLNDNIYAPFEKGEAVSGVTDKIRNAEERCPLNLFGTSSFFGNLVYYATPQIKREIKEKSIIVLLNSTQEEVPFYRQPKKELDIVLRKHIAGEIDLAEYAEIQTVVYDENNKGKQEYSDHFTLKGIDAFLGVRLGKEWFSALFSSLEEAEEFVKTIREGRFTFSLRVIPERYEMVPNEGYSIESLVQTLKNYGELDMSKVTDEEYLLGVCIDIMDEITLPFIKANFNGYNYALSVELAKEAFGKERRRIYENRA